MREGSLGKSQAPAEGDGVTAAVCTGVKRPGAR